MTPTSQLPFGPIALDGRAALACAGRRPDSDDARVPCDA